MKKNNMIVIVIIVAIVFGTAGFFGGMYYQKSQSVDQFMRVGNAQGQRFMMQDGTRTGTTRTQENRMFGAGQVPVRGEIISIDNTGITVKMQDGSTKIIVLSDKSTINKATTGSKSDLKTGEQVTVFGSTNTDGSITAQVVSLGTGSFPGGMMLRTTPQPK